MNYRMTRHDIALLTESIPAEEKTCGACAYWDHQSVRGLLVPAAAQTYGLCSQMAVDPDAGDEALLLLSEHSHCRNHACAYAPSSDYLNILWEEECVRRDRQAA